MVLMSFSLYVRSFASSLLVFSVVMALSNGKALEVKYVYTSETGIMSLVKT